ncbi:MAG: hypothetical protein KGI13_08315 [Betaproteobacteria bacterium]|nr:hypothetical protein [Betaproteobacteria bacterium]
MNRNSFIFHESEGCKSGLIGYQKPISHAMFAEYQMVEIVGTMLDLDVFGKSKLNADQWEAYCRLVLITFRDYNEKGYECHSYSLYRAMGNIEHAAFDIYKLNGVTNIAWDDDSLSRLRVVVKFIKDAVEVLNKRGEIHYLQLRVREESKLKTKTFYDHLAAMIFEVILTVFTLISPNCQCWWIQHNTVWGELFNFNNLDSIAGRIVKFKTRRLLYNEVVRMKKFPNFKGAKVLGFCLNVMGFVIGKDDYDRDSRALHKVILKWVRKNYAWLYNNNPQIAKVSSRWITSKSTICLFRS